MNDIVQLEIKNRIHLYKNNSNSINANLNNNFKKFQFKYNNLTQNSK